MAKPVRSARSAADLAFAQRVGLVVSGAIASVALARQSRFERQNTEVAAEVLKAKQAVAESRQTVAAINRLGRKVEISAG